MSQPPNTHDPHSVRAPHGLQNLPQVELEIVRGAARQRKRRIAGPAFLIGRADDSDLVLGDCEFPEAHSYILLGSQGVTIRYMGAGPELKVNDRAVSSSTLCDGDTIGSGPYEFLVRVSPPPYRGRPFDRVTSEAVDLGMAESSGDFADDGGPIAKTHAVGQEITLLSLPARELKPVGQCTLKLPYWLRPLLPRTIEDGAVCTSPKHFTATAGVTGSTLGERPMSVPKRAV
jgi:hypothetical protein